MQIQQYILFIDVIKIPANAEYIIPGGVSFGEQENEMGEGNAGISMLAIDFCKRTTCNLYVCFAVLE